MLIMNGVISIIRNIVYNFLDVMLPVSREPAAYSSVNRQSRHDIS